MLTTLRVHSSACGTFIMVGSGMSLLHNDKPNYVTIPKKSPMFLWVEERPHKQAVTATARVGRCFGVRRGDCVSVCPSCDKVSDKSNLRRASLGSRCEGTLHHKESAVAGVTRGRLWLWKLACSQLDRSDGREKNSDTQLPPPFLFSPGPQPCGQRGQSEFDFPALPLWKHTQIQSSRLWRLI